MTVLSKPVAIIEGATHQIPFDNAIVALVERRDGTRGCYLFLDQSKGIFYWDGRPYGKSKMGFNIQNEEFVSSYSYQEPKVSSNNIETMLNKLDKFKVPIKVFYTNNAGTKVSRNIRVEMKNEKTIVDSGIGSHWRIQEAICYKTEFSIMNTKGYKINFSKNYLDSIRKPFFAYQSCLIDSGEFQFQNSSTNFKQEMYMSSIASECLK